MNIQKTILSVLKEWDLSVSEEDALKEELAGHIADRLELNFHGGENQYIISKEYYNITYYYLGSETQEWTTMLEGAKVYNELPNFKWLNDSHTIITY